jgi:hypothetical protein
MAGSAEIRPSLKGPEPEVLNDNIGSSMSDDLSDNCDGFTFSIPSVQEVLIPEVPVQVQAKIDKFFEDFKAAVEESRYPRK